MMSAKTTKTNNVIIKMKSRIVALICAISLLLAQLPAWAFETTLPPEIKGVSQYRSLLLNGTFRDADKHWAAESLFLAGIQGFIKGDANGNINPDEPFTKKDALLSLAVLGGWMVDVQNPSTQLPTFGNPWDVWGRRVTEEARNKNILPKEGPALALDVPVTREEMAVWAAKVLNLQPVFGFNQSRIYNFGDWNRLQSDSVPWVETALQNALLNGSEENGKWLLKPEKTMTRGECREIL